MTIQTHWNVNVDFLDPGGVLMGKGVRSRGSLGSDGLWGGGSSGVVYTIESVFRNPVLLERPPDRQTWPKMISLGFAASYSVDIKRTG